MIIRLSLLLIAAVLSTPVMGDDKPASAGIAPARSALVQHLLGEAKNAPDATPVALE